MCCTFNMVAAEEIFRQSQYTEMVQRMQQRDLENAFGDRQPPKAYIQNNEPKTKVGRNKGLTLILDAHTNLLAPATVTDDIQGSDGTNSNMLGFG